MSYDPLRQRVSNAESHLRGRIRQAKQDLSDARLRLALLEELEITLNLEGITDLIPEASE